MKRKRKVLLFSISSFSGGKWNFVGCVSLSLCCFHSSTRSLRMECVSGRVWEWVRLNGIACRLIAVQVDALHGGQRQIIAKRFCAQITPTKGSGTQRFCSHRKHEQWRRAESARWYGCSFQKRSFKMLKTVANSKKILKLTIRKPHV